MNLYGRSPWVKSALTAFAVIFFTAVALGLHAVGVADASIVLTLLLAVVLSSWAFGLAYSILASVLAILAHSFLFSVPIYSFEVYDPQHLMAFAFLVAVGLVVSTLSRRLRDQFKILVVREERLDALHRLGQALSGQIDRTDVVQTAQTLLSEILGGPVKIEDAGAAPATGTRAFALTGGRTTLGWLTFSPGSGPDPFLPERRIWIETLLSPVALALERVDLIQEQREQSRNLEATVTRNTILHGISHDLRTPLTVISATAGSILDATPLSDPRRGDLENLAQESQSLVRQVENLLDLTSLTSGSVKARREWMPLDELIYPRLEAFSLLYPEIRPDLELPEADLLCHADEALVARALNNLLENAALYAPGPITVGVVREPGLVRFEVSDRGQGVPTAERKAIFSQFVRGDSSRRAAGHRGSGLGLALVQSVAALHGGDAGVREREGGGSVFWFTLRQDETAPELWGTSP